ncbi:MAG: DsbA family protein [Candidatus Levybacteria bacterium]|nr:DsbA family protein [Candidatus Levybacteria bacterium]
MLEKNQSSGLAPQGQTGETPSEKVDVKGGQLPVFGQQNAKVTMIEFSDFECPFCKSYFDQTLSQIKKDYVDKGLVKLYYRHFPLDFHPAAMPAALASECANEQDKFWEYHDKIFTEQDKISGKTADVIATQLKLFAQELGLNTSQFDGCLDNTKFQANVDADLNDGRTAGVSGTPTFFINGNRLVGAQPYASFKALIDEELK